MRKIHPYCLLLLSFLCLFQPSKAQTISGYIGDSTRKPLAFASLLLLRDSLVIDAATSNEMGRFELKARLENQQHYSLKVSLVGYQSRVIGFVYPDTILLQSIVLSHDRQLLGNVIVNSRKPLITRLADRYIVNVENSFLANGNSGLEVLQQSPGVWVNSQGDIKIKGNQSALVMINDVVQRMSSDELAEYLRTLRSEDISRIEIITNPPSEFEASGTGGIIHIILKHARQDGLNGSVSAGYRQQGSQPAYNLGGALNYKNKKFYLDGSINGGEDRNRSRGSNLIIYPDGSIYSTEGRRFNDNLRGQYRFSLGYDLSKTQSIGLQVLGQSTRLNNQFDNGIDYQSGAQHTIGSAHTDWVRSPSQTNATFNYIWRIDSLGSQLKLIADYTHTGKKDINTYTSSYNDVSQDLTYRNHSPNSTSIYTAQADYTKVTASKWEIKGGFKYAQTQRDDQLIREDKVGDDWIINTGISNHFTYTESLVMFYASTAKTFNKTSIKAGLRAENTHGEGNSITADNQFTLSYFDLFPSFFITQNLNEKKGNALYFSYSRRIQRPAFTSLNPYRVQFDSHTIMIGNPFLLPQFGNNLELGLNFLTAYSASIYFSSTSDIIASLATPTAGNIIEYQPHNFNNSTEYGFQLNAPVKITRNWSAENNFSIFNLSYRLNDYRLHESTFSINTIHTVTIPKLVDITFSADYRSPYVEANTRLAEQFYSELGITRNILKGKGKLRLFAYDLFNTAREHEVNDYNGTHIDFHQKRQTRNLSLLFSYNFSRGKKFSAKKIDQSNAEEKSRVEN